MDLNLLSIKLKIKLDQIKLNLKYMIIIGLVTEELFKLQNLI